MSSYIVTNGTTVDGRSIDVEIRDGIIDRVLPAGEGDPTAFADDRRLDADGRLVTPPLVEPHTHLDHTLTAGNPHWNESNTLAGGIEKWREIRDDLTVEDVKRRATRCIEWFLAHGVTKIRTHVNTGYDSLVGMRALRELQMEFDDLVDLQLVAFPADGLMTEDGANVDLLSDAIDLGADLVGGIPHIEYTEEDGIAHVEHVVDVAERRNLALDLHIDETDDPQSRYTERLASEVLKRGIGDRATASHATAMHSYSNAYANKLIGLIADSGLDVITNPMSNAALQGTYDDYPRRRGYTRIKELQEAGVTVGVGQDDVLTLINNYGDGDPLKNLFLLSHYGHMNGYNQAETLWEMQLTANAEIFGLQDYGLAAGNEGSIVVYEAADAFDAIRTQAPCKAVIRNGDPIVHSEHSTVITRDGESQPVDFGRE